MYPHTLQRKAEQRARKLASLLQTLQPVPSRREGFANCLMLPEDITNWNIGNFEALKPKLIYWDDQKRTLASIIWKQAGLPAADRIQRTCGNPYCYNLEHLTISGEALQHIDIGFCETKEVLTPEQEETALAALDAQLSIYSDTENSGK